MVAEAKNIYMVGIKGVGMTALAEILRGQGSAVSGSDTEETFFTDSVLASLSIPVQVFGKGIPEGTDLVIYSSAYNDTNLDIAEAKQRDIPAIPYVDALAEVFNTHTGILITGSHGKTTTTAMIGTVLEAAGYDPTVLVGAKVVAWGRNARIGKSKWMVAEGDEYQNKFLSMKPQVLVITNIEYDHPDFFKTEEDYKNTFVILLKSMPKDGVVIAEKNIEEFVQEHAVCNVVTYELQGDALGRHYELNAEAARSVAAEIGISNEVTTKALAEFRGTVRRFEYYTQPDANVVVIDDYAHHPTEIRATLAMLQKKYPDRQRIAVFMPHTYSRTQALLDEFATSFPDASEVVLLDIYSSARENRQDFPADLNEQLFSKVKSNHPDVVFKHTNDQATLYLREKIKQADQNQLAIITLGAGDSWQIAASLRDDV
jgi:UDP-N-acetylmuramate--alanine ligase